MATARPREKKMAFDPSVRGSTGLPVYAGRVYDEILPELAGERGRRTLREMSEQDPIIGGILFGIEMLARQVPWTIKPADDTALAKKIADHVDECLTDMHPNWENTLSEILSMLVYGWSWLELVYKKREGMKLDDPIRTSQFNDGKIGWASWSIRSQETLWRWEYSDNDKGFVSAMTQLGPPDWVEHTIPYAKSLHFTTRSRRENPEGVSILRNAYRAWFMKKNIEVIEGIGIERDLAGLPVLYAPAEIFSQGADDKQKALLAHLQTLVTAIKRDEQEGVLMPMAYDPGTKEPIYKLELLATGGDRQFDTNAIVGRYNEMEAMSMMADFILMGHESVGSFALSSTKTGLFSTALGAILDSVSAVINQRGIPKLVRLNGWPLDKSPTLEHGQVEAADMGKLGAFLKALADAGMAVFPNEELEKYVLEQAGLPVEGRAGEYPMPGQAVLGVPAGAPRVLPGQQPQLPAGTGKPGIPASTLRPAGPSIPKSPTPSRPQAGQRKVASESANSHRRFVPLGARVVKLDAQLREALEPEAYSALLANVMRIGKFSKLPAEDQEAILAAEEASLSM